jgi:hypothetical protein
MRLLILSALVAVALLPACASRTPPPPPPTEIQVVVAPPPPPPPPLPEAPAELAFASVRGLKMPQVW